MSVAEDIRAEVALHLRAETANDAARTVECWIATESAVPMLDYERWEMLDEILLARGARLPTQVPLLDTHSRDSVERVLGSLRNLRVEKDRVCGTIHFDESEPAQRAYGKVARGHITDVSAGYRVVAAVEIEPGETAKVEARDFTAGQRRMRVATSWDLREGSLVPIGADREAKIRAAQEERRRSAVAGTPEDSMSEKATTPPETVLRPSGVGSQR